MKSKILIMDKTEIKKLDNYIFPTNLFLHSSEEKTSKALMSFRSSENTSLRTKSIV